MAEGGGGAIGEGGMGRNAMLRSIDGVLYGIMSGGE